jgi:plastocyanin
MRRILGAIVIPFLLLAAGPALGDDVTVHVGHNRLDPAEVSIAVGDTVTFHNMDEMPGGHTIVADDGSFQSPALAKDDSWTHTFTEAGSYGYHIKEHADAKGKVVVE